MNKNEVKDLYTKGCNEYLLLFCEKHGFDYEDAKDSWVANEVGGMVCVNDYFVDMQTIITDVEHCVDESEFIKWYDYCLEANEFGLTIPNYSSWLKGCPRTSAESFDNLRAIKRNLERAIEIEKQLRGGGNY